MPTQYCFKDFAVPKDAIHHMCPNNDNNNIPVKPEENKQQEGCQWVWMHCKGCFICRRNFHAMLPALEMKEPLTPRGSGLLPGHLELRKGSLSYTGVFGKGPKQRP